MNKVIILSVQPQYLHKIITGKKTIEIRKSMPKCDYPIDVYLYCTKSKNYLVKEDNYETIEPLFNYKICYSSEYDELVATILNGKIVAKFTLNKVDKINNYGSCFEIVNESYAYTNAIGNRSCLDFIDMKKYLNDKGGYAWYIDNLEIFDKSMELSEFRKVGCKEIKNLKENNGSLYYFDKIKPLNYFMNPACRKCKYYNDDFNTCERKEGTLTRPFQSWGYAYKE